MIFDSGAGLINHVYNNRCRDRSGRIQNKMNQDTLREHRAIAAMHLDAISHYRSTTGLEIEELQKMRGGTSVTDTSEGGVPLNLMDDDAPYGQLLAPLSIDPRSEEGETTAADVDETPVKGLSLELSTSSNVSGKGKGKVIDLIEGLTDLHVGSSTESTPEGPKTPAWSKKLFPDAKPTPVQRGWAQPAKPTPANRVWAQPTMPDIGRNILPVNSCQGTEYLVRTDWDNMNLERQLDGDFHCPFTNCP